MTRNTNILNVHFELNKKVNSYIFDHIIKDCAKNINVKKINPKTSKHKMKEEKNEDIICQ